MVAELVRVVDDKSLPTRRCGWSCDRPHRCAGDGEDRVGVVPAHEGSVAVDDFAGTLSGLGGGLADQHHAGSRERRLDSGAEDTHLREGGLGDEVPFPGAQASYRYKDSPSAWTSQRGDLLSATETTAVVRGECGRRGVPSPVYATGAAYGPQLSLKRHSPTSNLELRPNSNRWNRLRHAQRIASAKST